MDDELRARIEREIEKHALHNALKHESAAQVGAIMGPLMGENPDFREYGDEIPAIAGPILDSVNDLDQAEQRDRLEALDPAAIEELEAEDETDEHALPDLPNAEDGTVRMRVAPNPNGPWHLGHARMPAVIGSYKERYDGSFICRFDDTDPETKRPDLTAYDQILADIEYLGFEPDRVLRASDRLETYYDHARRLIDAGGAYTCSCGGEEFSELKNAGEACPHRGKDPETVHEEFEAMVDGEYDSGEMVLRVKTDITHKNPALRDWVAFRMIDTPHPREAANEYRCWPMLDFQSGIDDHLTEVTHIIRGIDLQDSAKRQQFVYDYFDWEYPEVVHWGHVQIDEYDVSMSTSTIKERIDAGDLDGWDDPRAPTIRSVKRRGIRGEAIVSAMVDLGTSTSNVDLSMSTVYARNRELIDDETDRRFFVRESVDAYPDGDPEPVSAVTLPIEGGPDTAKPPLHPDHEDRGTREIPVGDAVRLEESDRPAEGERVWLKGFGAVRNEGDRLVATRDGLEVVTDGDVPVVHWVPAAESVPVRMHTMEGVVRGWAEPGLREYEPDDLVQFERVGFARIDGRDGEETVTYFTHP
ncbi:glutamyl-tRNA synthetase [Halodesulfurarchaeum formicicum]|uniref:Glutamate--tRNA ligase n=1 Tax=Halodesulfurarchaeum formicicum TaxID=1873524 RepID=A0A1D8S3P3_9EURY|nr:glutamate--tRNA ligase [Halodesulfurarchaeum formicicum]AOW79951.1 glutamyl-tRNA synthetase [Halodesulfurarchaeum formicicum]APE95244.1 glutamyl-tRNA synthetase [Halodesulfurarchaeum formicicum]